MKAVKAGVLLSWAALLIVSGLLFAGYQLEPVEDWAAVIVASTAATLMGIGASLWDECRHNRLAPGYRNSRVGVEHSKVANGWHHLNTRLPWHCDLVDVLRGVRNQIARGDSQ